MPRLLRLSARTSCFGVTRRRSTASGTLIPCAWPRVLIHMQRALWMWPAIIRTVRRGAPGTAATQSLADKCSIRKTVILLFVRHTRTRPSVIRRPILTRREVQATFVDEIVSRNPSGSRTRRIRTPHGIVTGSVSSVWSCCLIRAANSSTLCCVVMGSETRSSGARPTLWAGSSWFSNTRTAPAFSETAITFPPRSCRRSTVKPSAFVYQATLASRSLTVSDASRLSPCKFCSISPRRRQRDIPILHRPVIALQHDRPRLFFVAVERPARDPRNVGATNHLMPVEHHRDHPPHQGDVVGLPLGGALPAILLGNDKPVDRAEAAGGRLAPCRILDLSLIASAQIHAAVARRRIAKLEVQREVAVGPIGHEIAAALRI